MKVNIEVNHATLSGHDFHHEVAAAFANGIFGSIDANAGDDRLGWDLDRFPVSVEQMTLGMLEILRGGGFTTGGLNFDSKLRRQSIDRNDLFLAHIGGIDTMAHALVVAADILETGTLDARRAERYAGWSGELGQSILDGKHIPGVTPRARPRRQPLDHPRQRPARAPRDPRRPPHRPRPVATCRAGSGTSQQVALGEELVEHASVQR